MPVITNVDAAPVTTGAAARDALARQVDSPVRWVESVERLVAGHGVGRIVEIGPGAVLTGLMRRIDRQRRGRQPGRPGGPRWACWAAAEDS